MKRREFLKTTGAAILGLTLGIGWKEWLYADDLFRLTLLQTNDTHSRIDPFPPDSGRNAGLGGIARRATFVKQVRQENPHTLLLDAGDVFQGTPYFNLYRGKIEYHTMSLCGYDVVTLGNHEFDNGVASLYQAMEYAQFELVNCNYQMDGTPLVHRVKPYVLKSLGEIRVGITGVGVRLDDLVAPKNREGIRYLDPRPILKEIVNILRYDHRCALVVVISHLGIDGRGDHPGDRQLARDVEGIDFIVGGHSHTFMQQPEVVRSPSGHPVHIFQVGYGGIYVGRSDLFFRRDKLVGVYSSVIPMNASLVPDESVLEHPVEFIGRVG
ncbi:MAG: bifunctional metallophosphatase/5'-nucleotidase [Calditrichaeota bacterium]|nr:bifunctional metallophosphatase/5'-nucleotidase [Calditrichota bacterium]